MGIDLNVARVAVLSSSIAVTDRPSFYNCSVSYVFNAITNCAIHGLGTSGLQGYDCKCGIDIKSIIFDIHTDCCQRRCDDVAKRISVVLEILSQNGIDITIDQGYWGDLHSNMTKDEKLYKFARPKKYNKVIQSPSSSRDVPLVSQRHHAHRQIGLNIFNPLIFVNFISFLIIFIAPFISAFINFPLCVLYNPLFNLSPLYLL